MSISLARVKLVQLFLHPDGSVKGISFIHEDDDLEDLGCCDAEPDCWHVFFQPKYLLFTPKLGCPVGRGFFPVESVNFAENLVGPEPESMAIEMQGSVKLHLSPSGLQMDVGREVGKDLLEYIDLPRATKNELEMVVVQPTTTPESEFHAVHGGMSVRCRKRVLEKVKKALKSCFGMRSVIARLSTRVGQIERRQDQ